LAENTIRKYIAVTKLFQSLRSTRQTELVEAFPLHVVCAWLGNSAAVAAKHYLQVRDEDFQRAIQEAVQNPVQQAPESGRKAWHPGPGNPEIAQKYDALPC